MPFFDSIIRYTARNHFLRGRWVSWSIVPAVTEN